MPHFYAGANAATHASRFYRWLAASVVVIAALQFFDSHTKTDVTPDGVISFMFLNRTPEGAAAALRAWTAAQKQWAAFALGFDYLFMPCYSCMIAGACIWAAEIGRFLPTLGTVLAWAMIPAALFDAAENYGLFMLLTGSEHATWGAPTFFCTIAKFSLLAAGSVYVAAAAVATRCCASRRKSD